jgi:hypothetical protein
MPSFDLASTYVCLSPSGSAATIEVTSQFWTTIDERSDLAEGRLVAVFRCDVDWPHWEMHPHGEEILVLLSGKVTMVFDEESEERNVALEEAARVSFLAGHGIVPSFTSQARSLRSRTGAGPNIGTVEHHWRF